MKSPRPTPLPWRQLVLSGALAFILGSCGDAAPAPVEKPPASEDREAVARSLYTKSISAPVEEKVDLLRRIAGVYGDTKVAPRAHFEFVFYLLLCEPARMEEALTAARSFAERHPKEPLVSEAFHRVEDRARFEKRADISRDARAAWGTWLETRDSADDLSKAVILPDLVTLRILEERWTDVKVALEAAVAIPDLPRYKKAELLHRKGDLLSHFLDDPNGAMGSLTESLAICADLEAMKTPMRHDQDGVLQSLAYAAGKSLRRFVVLPEAD